MVSVHGCTFPHPRQPDRVLMVSGVLGQHCARWPALEHHWAAVHCLRTMWFVLLNLRDMCTLIPNEFPQRALSGSLADWYASDWL